MKNLGYLLAPLALIAAPLQAQTFQPRTEREPNDRSVDPIIELQKSIFSCREKMQSLVKVTKSGMRDINWIESAEDPINRWPYSCQDIGRFLAAHAHDPITEKIRQHFANSPGSKSWGAALQSMESNFTSYEQGCQELTGVDPKCESWVVASGLTAPLELLQAMDVIEARACDPGEGWSHCKFVDAPNVRVQWTDKASESAAENVGRAFRNMKLDLRDAASPSKMGNLTYYLTNAETKAEIEALQPFGQSNNADWLRGGASQDGSYVWVSEQMLCKTGVETRVNAQGDRIDNDQRTFDQVVHETAHAFDKLLGLDPFAVTKADKTTEEIYADDVAQYGSTAKEYFAYGAQKWFFAREIHYPAPGPDGKLTTVDYDVPLGDNETPYFENLFSQRTDLSALCPLKH